MGVERKRQVAKTADQIGADQPAGFSLADVDVVAAFFLCRRRENGRRQAVRLAQPRRQGHSAD